MLTSVVRCALSVVLAMAASGPAAAGDCDQWAGGPFVASSPNGTNGVVRAAIHWDPDAGGPLPGMLVMAGNFTSVEGMAANSIAMLSPSTGQWQALGSGIVGTVRALTIWNGQLVAGGTFSTAGGQPASNIARFDGAAWHPIGGGIQLNPGGDSGVFALLYHAGLLIAGGNFQGADGQAIPDLAVWNGSVWSGSPFWSLSGGHPGSSSVDTAIYTFALTSDYLFVGGSFGIVAWDLFVGWTALYDQDGGSGVNGPVTSILPLAGVWGNSMVLVGGTFNSAAFNPCQNTAIWSANQWNAVPGMNMPVTCFSSDENGKVIAASSNGVSGAIHTLNTTTWEWQATTSVSTNGTLYCMLEFNDWLFVGGALSNVAQVVANNISRRVNGEWHPFGGESATNVRAMHVLGPRLLVGGDFQQDTTSGAPASGVFVWDGASSSSLGLGDEEVLDIFSHDLNDGSGNHELIIARATLPRVIRATVNPNDNPLQPTFTNMGPAVGASAIPGAVNVIERFNNDYYMGGQFNWTSGRAHIARWTGTAWTQVLGGVDSFVFAMEVYNGSMYVGGTFGTASGGTVTAARLARWNGTAWSAVNNAAFNGTATVVYALEIYDGRLIVGGQFPGAASSPNIAAFNGSIVASIGPFGQGGANGPVRSLKTIGDRLYVGGDFTMIDGVSANRIAYWDGDSWHSVDGGADATVYAIEQFGNTLHVGGTFDSMNSGALVAANWARFEECQTCPADINNDGLVNVTDLLAVISAWGTCTSPPCAADVNGDDQINVTDLLAVISAWGACD